MIRIGSILFSTLFLLSLSVQAQEMYQTLKGNVEIVGKGEGELGAITARSDRLTVRVEHETGRVFMNLDQSTLRTGIDSIDQIYASRPEDRIRFEGKLARGGFDPNYCYSASPLRLEGTLSYEGFSEDITGRGEFESRFSNDRIPCLLDITFKTELKGSKWPNLLPGFEDELRIRIVHAILNPKMD